MLWKDVQKMGIQPYQKTIRYGFSPIRNNLILGYDTEYDSKTRELLSVQFGYEDIGITYIEGKDFDVDDNGKIPVIVFRELIKRFLKENKIQESVRHRTIILYAYFDIAELQHFDISSDELFFMENPFTYSVKIYSGKRMGTQISKKTGKNIKKPQSGNIYIEDLFGWFQGGLGKLAKNLLGLDKKEYDTTKITRKDLDNPVFLEYAAYDAILCYKIAKTLRSRFINLFGVDITATKTTANTSSAIFRKHYLNKDEELTQRNTAARRQALLSAWGGVNLAFYRGIYKGNFYYYDGKSLFPSCAIQIKKMPIDGDWFKVEDAEDFRKINGVASVNFKFPKTENYPCLPVIAIKPSQRMFFPLEGRSDCTSFEIALALEWGAEIKLLYGYGYKNGDTRFAKYLIDMMVKKDEADKLKNEADRFIYKLASNSIIGKTQQHVQKIELEYIMNNTYKIDGKSTFIKEADYEAPIHFGNLYMPEWNTLILGKSRAINAKVFKKTNSYVGTTDSSITREDFGEGFWIDGIYYKLEKTGNELGILRSKFYYLDDKYSAHHAIRLRGKHFSLIPDIIKMGLKSPLIAYKAEQIVKMRTAIKRNKTFGEMERVYFDFNAGFDNKRQLFKDGHTEPWLSIKEYVEQGFKSIKEYKSILNYRNKDKTEQQLTKYSKNHTHNWYSNIDVDKIDWEAINDNTLTKNENQKIKRDLWKNYQ